MAGYIFNLDSTDSLRLYAENGIYSTKLHTPDKHWKNYHEGTFADYATMKEGDNVYFFIKRKIYGIGVLTNVGEHCRYSNYPNACIPNPYKYQTYKDKLLWDEDEHSIDQRWVCLFKPDPYFFTLGVDMDDVLSSNPDAFRMLRTLWKLSFIKFDDIENQSFRDILLKRNQNYLTNPVIGKSVYENKSHQLHTGIVKKLKSDNYNLTLDPILSTCNSNDSINHEMAIEAGILYQLASSDKHTTDTFGNWDYISHQVVASPFKPIDYMDKMDLFGYSYIYQNTNPPYQASW